MGRQKTITDDAVLRIARDIFRAQGHSATTRAIAKAAGISEAVLYQRFGSKDQLFFAAMHPLPPDVERLLGPAEPTQDAHAYLCAVVVRLAKHFAEVIPVVLRMLMHPSFDPASLRHAQPGGPALVHDGLAKRLEALARRGALALPRPAATARLLISIAHDWALRHAHGDAGARIGELRPMVDVVWHGLQPPPRDSGNASS
jgi:AcrR family transcriptional regulator